MIQEKLYRTIRLETFDNLICMIWLMIHQDFGLFLEVVVAITLTNRCTCVFVCECLCNSLTESNICRHLRLTEMLRANSRSSELVVMTLPLPKRGATSPALYTAWLDIMTKDMPPTLFIRGNQQSVLTFYS